ncbi:MAG: hypothetical protein JXO44_15515 [Clostridia bacterium]|nr:hypothetical protein [Clostridia bacterium]
MRHHLAAFCILLLPSASFAAGCEAYPYTDGINIEDVNGGVKIIATSSAVVSFDDPASIHDAKEEASLLAKAEISKFLSQTISSDETVAKAVNETKSMSGAGKVVERKETIERVKMLRNSSQALLRGVVTLGDCYTKAHEVRVSVGVKPETINAAGSLAGGMSNSVANNPTPTTGAGTQGAPTVPSSSSTGSAREPLQGVDSYSNTNRLKNF